MILQKACDFIFVIFFLNILVGIISAQLENTPVTKDQNATGPEVTISQGTLQGITMLSKYNRNIFGFLGIPYAQPPIGNLRFNKPIVPEPWTGTLNATIEGNSCPQVGNVGDEDCLYLNVYTPQLPENNDPSLLPVMVFIPGGGFESGSGNSSFYGPNHLLDADLVLVTINYRLGPLGFLSTGDEVAPGNWGLKDQVLALQWVQKNIAHFGGDPNQVTLFGQSAGGASVQLLALSKSTIGLFHKYISQSGAAFGFWMYRPRSVSANLAFQLGGILGCPTNTSSLLVDCLREINASDIINTRSKFMVWDSYPVVVWGPTDEPDIDGAVLTDTPANLFAAGEIRDLPSITGIVKDEGVGFSPGPFPDSEAFGEFLEDIDNLLPVVIQYFNQVNNIPSFTAALKEFYFNNVSTTNRTELWAHCVELISDSFFFHPVYSALQKQLTFAKNPTFFYSFEYRGTYSYTSLLSDDAGLLDTSVTHIDELIYLFPQIEWLVGAQFEDMSESDHQMVETMVQLWTSFAINGAPTTTAMISNTTWLPYSKDGNYLRIGNGPDPTLDLRYDFLPERMQFWDKLTATGSGNVAYISQFLRWIFAFLIAFQIIV